MRICLRIRICALPANCAVSLSWLPAVSLSTSARICIVAPLKAFRAPFRGIPAQTHSAAVFRRPAAAACLPAVWCEDRPVCLFPFIPEKITPHADLNKVPGENLVLFPLSQGVKIHVHADVGRGLFPAVIIPGLQPAVKQSPQAVSLRDQVRRPAVAAGKNPLQIDHRRIMPAVSYTLVIMSFVDRMVDRGGKPQIITRAIHRRPLERGKWLGNKKRSAHRDLAAPVSFLLRHFFVIRCRDLICQIRDRDTVFLCLCGKSQHKIEFDLVPSAPESLPGTIENLLFCYPLVDDITQTLRTCLRRKGQTALSHILHPCHQIQRKGIDPERRHLQLHPVRLPAVGDIVHNLVNTGIVAGTEGTEQDIILPCTVQHRIRKGLHGRKIPLPVGTIDHSRLAETTSPDTSALQLYRNTILRHCDKGNQGFRRIWRLFPAVQVRSHLPADAGRRIPPGQEGCNCPVFFISHLVQGRHIDSGNLRCRMKKSLPALSCLFHRTVQIQQRIIGSLSFPDIKHVKKPGHRLRIESTRAASYDDRILFCPL